MPISNNFLRGLLGVEGIDLIKIAVVDFSVGKIDCCDVGH